MKVQEDYTHLRFGMTCGSVSNINLFFNQNS